MAANRAVADDLRIDVLPGGQVQGQDEPFVEVALGLAADDVPVVVEPAVAATGQGVAVVAITPSKLWRPHKTGH